MFQGLLIYCKAKTLPYYFLMDKTICAISSPLGFSGIGIVRISGPQTYPILDRLFKDKAGRSVKVGKLPSHTVRYGFIVAQEKVQDEVLLTIMKAPKSYTRQDMAEIGCHGGFIPLKSVLQTLISAGCRLAEPGEFTKRAFLSGRIDLAQAEAVLAVINSKTEQASSAAINQLQGGLSQKIGELENRALEILAEIETEIEFPEELEDSRTDYRKRLAESARAAKEILAGTEKGNVLSEGLKVAILGRPNVGKSSLLNSLLSEERAIVTEIPGTTRDQISEIISIAGFPLKVIDTAGIRPPRDKIEEAGVKKSRTLIKTAELILLVLDQSEPLQTEDKDLITEVPKEKTILVINKSDLPDRLTKESEVTRLLNSFSYLKTSALKDRGIEELKKRIAEFIQEGKIFPEGIDPVFLALEQKNALEETSKSLDRAISALKDRMPLEFVAEDLKRATESLARLSGHRVTEEVLDRIFSRFCLGK